ncbi:pentatricopeptide repeat-containing protein At5g13770, chloroplastic isoform X1 [Herrania umbratica]|uniref:Pentatricopeptide repeat-containing protein At5g13770, chloroplastic isoform X1 n=1 Tax=Herrania umbratica TaxID=108875 RepID=A0A6J0ZSX6_9ROSI|nr:pentatricopeptide repeat-containing protein At5g13770, chloroplastic isoform X1 [Herrania umbratica]XP_021277883.1 pentatricopeptide repeat-containing protein At5g13770, chloroplastic isoform X1 [Herrania umbratica]XP_021277884.1 pentatricopeptide repeat-containing protein At5g13770, chloroplastic isoform X1 [Herrania umbratica]XP_021277885.1 pentatricopeptide repeat-containing protein At5g13770, chloroplastic isoform X1 [Herrania umbratica]XP_021277887.1 pentatricopeptide repeat-containing 
MAISSSPDWSLASTDSHTSKTRKNGLFSSCKTLHFVSFPTSNLPLFHIYSSGCPSPILEDASATVPSTKLELKFQGSQQLSLPDVDNLNSFLCGLLQDTENEGLAYDYYEKAKQRPGFIPEKPLLQLLIRYLVQSKKWDLVMSLSEDFKHYHVLPDSYTCSRLINACIRARKFKVVDTLLQVFKSDKVVALLAFNSAMAGYNKLHMFRSTIAVYETMKLNGIFQDSESYCQIMEAYQHLGDMDKVAAFFDEFVSRKFDLTPAAPRVYSILCESLGKSGRAYEALEYFRDMTKKGIPVSSSVYSSLIRSFASIRDLTVAEELLKEAAERRMVRDPEVFLKLVLMYIDEGLLEKTLEIVRVMKDANIKVSDCIFCTIVNGFSKRRGYQSAIVVYEELLSQGCKPGQVTYASIINAHCRIGLNSKAETVFSEMEEKGFDKCVVAYSSMIAMYGKAGRIRDAMKLVAKMKHKGCQPNVWIYNSLMDMHGRLKNLRQVEKLWKEMKRRKTAPDKVSYTTIISAYSRAREYEMCLKCYQEFRLNGGLIDKAMAGIMVGIFSKTSRIDELVKLLQDMKTEGTQLDGRLYHSAMNALRDAGLETQAKWLQKNFDAK